MSDSADSAGPLELVETARVALGRGSVVAIPTDTVYGLAVDPARAGATAALFALKGRPASVDLPVLVADVAQADALASPRGLPPAARRLADRFWPGALTVVVPRRSSLDWELGGSGDTIGIRCPAHGLVRALCRAVGPLATTSANRHGHPPLVTAAEVTAEFGPELLVLDGGRCDGAPSTVVDATADPVCCVRHGAIAWADVFDALGGDAGG